MDCCILNLNTIIIYYTFPDLWLFIVESLANDLQHILMRISFFNGGETFSALAVVDVGVELLVETAF